MSINPIYQRIIMKCFLLFVYVVFALSCSRKTDFEKYLIEKSDPQSDVKLLFNQKNDTCKTSFCLNTIKINGMLVNMSKDPVSFLSYTCQGEDFLFECDTTQYEASPNMWCQIIYPVKKTIAPGDSIKVSSTLFPKDSSFRVVENIGFRLLKISKDTISNIRDLDYKDIDSLTFIGAIKESLLKGEHAQIPLTAL